MRHALLALACAAMCGHLHAQPAPPPTLKLELGGGVTMDMILIQPGQFEQGSPEAEAGREADESRRSVRLTRPYYIGKFPVTRGQFARFVETMRYRTEAESGPSGGYGVENGTLVQRKQFIWRNPGFPQTDEHPVVLVTAKDADAFCKWLTTRNARLCELPTEAQWEYACRAGTTGAHYAEPVNDVAWFRGNSDAQTHPVGQKKPNPWGLHDLYGPVWQWCSDWYAPYPAGTATDPRQTNQNLSDKPRQVLRGGSFLSDVSHARSAERYRNDAHSRNADNGFRIICATTARPQTPPNPRTNPTPARPAMPTPPPAHTSTPPMHFEPSSPSGGGGFMPMIIVGGLMLVAFKVISALLKSFSGRPGGITPSNLTPRGAADLLGAGATPIAQRFAFRMSDSGFYITGPEAAVGSVIHYTADLGDRVLTDELTFTPGPEGQFVFTGAKPRSVSVRTTGGQLGTTGGSTMSSFDDDDRFHTRSSSSSFSRPSAY